jgi:hypothetical protein
MDYIGPSIVLTGFRSAAPVSLRSLGDLPELHEHYWDHGLTNQDPGVLSRAKHANPMFASLITDIFTLHYGTDPLLGFHLATAYAPLTPESPLSLKQSTGSRLNRVVEAAQLQFREWAISFRRRTSQNLVMRFFSGDALAFCHTLQHKRIAPSDISAYWYRSPYRLEPLMLDGIDYGTTGKAPILFNVIDKSNLVDHVGAINILVAASPLLQNNISVTIYMESLVKHTKSYKALMDKLYCGHFPTVSVLVGLFPVEYWTNASSVSTAEEGLLDKTTTRVDTTGDHRGQIHVRLAWKLPFRH